MKGENGGIAMTDWKTMVANTLIEAVISGLLVSVVLGYYITSRDEKIKNSIQEEFKKRDVFFNAQFNFKQRSLEELLGPIIMQLKRSQLALDAYKPNNAYREGILKQCNESVRDLLLTKGFLIPSDLQSDAGDLIRHYDEWLEAYDQLRVKSQDKTQPFVFTYDFPKQAEEHFVQKYEDYRKELKIEETLK